MVKVTSEIKGPWLNILINDHLHLAIYRPSLIKIQSWANHPPKWKFWASSRYFVETTHKQGVQDLSDYSDRFLWIMVLKEVREKCNCIQQIQDL